MPASHDRSDFSSVNIDSEASLSIYLYPRDGSQTPPDRSRQASGHHDHIVRKLAHPAQDPQRTTDPSVLTLEKVLNMPLEQLDRLQERVGQMEISNHRLLTRIYGDFAPDNQPFSLIISSRMAASDFPASGSPQHRQLIFSQYTKMVAIAQDPTRTVNIVEPATARGARALQDYQMQLMLLAAQRKGQTKRKHHEQDTPPRQRPPPLRTNSEHLRAMQESCRVLDLHPRPALPMDHRNRRVIQNNSALSDYQTQLLHLEEQNKKRLLLARQTQNGAADGHSREAHRESQREQTNPVRYDQSALPIRTQRSNSR